MELVKDPFWRPGFACTCSARGDWGDGVAASSFFHGFQAGLRAGVWLEAAPSRSRFWWLVQARPKGGRTPHRSPKRPVSTLGGRGALWSAFLEPGARVRATGGPCRCVLSAFGHVDAWGADGAQKLHRAKELQSAGKTKTFGCLLRASNSSLHSKGTVKKSLRSAAFAASPSIGLKPNISPIVLRVEL